jgi:GNAT superfamily N-acetyltransferase
MNPLPAKRKQDQVAVRRATKGDSAQFLLLITAFAKAVRHHKTPDSAAKRRLIHDIFSRKRVHLFVATFSKRLVGYALYFYTYSSFVGKPNLYIEDLFVLDEYKNQGIGRLLFMKCAQEAQRNNCSVISWAVLTWNKKALRFYHKLGAERVRGLYIYKLTSDKLKSIRATGESMYHTKK